jgi:hypothetical protein
MSLALALSLSACVITDPGPDPALVEACKQGIPELRNLMHEAEQKNLTASNAYILSYRLLTKAQLNLNNKQYGTCVDRLARGQQYMEQLLKEGKDV